MADKQDLEISLDKLPIKRLDAIEESGVERFPPEIDYEEKTVNLIRRIDFAWAVERDAKKPKKAKEASTPSNWQGLIENLQLAHQELSVVIDLINTVEANDAVAVAHMFRPKPLPNESLSDLAVSVATKLQCYRHLSKYFKQSAKSLEHKIAKEERFYGALIRLQQNWKVKWHRLAANAPGSDGFLIDLSNNIVHDQPVAVQSPAFSIVRVEHDSSGMLAVNLPKSSCLSLRFGFQDSDIKEGCGQTGLLKNEESSRESLKDSVDEDKRIRETHRVLCNAHRAIFYEQVFELVSRESFNPSLGVNVTGIRENYLELSIKPGVSVFMSLVPFNQEDQGMTEGEAVNTDESSITSSLVERKEDVKLMSRHPNHITYEIYIQQLFHDEIFGKMKHQPTLPGKTQSNQQTNDAMGLVNHFCLSLAHRIFSNKVLTELENLVTKIPYLQLTSQPTWHSRTSSWMLFVKVPEAVLNAQSQAWRSDEDQVKSNKLLYQAKVVVKDDCISIEGGGAPNVVGFFKGNHEAISSRNKFNCDIVDLPMVLLLQIASQIIRWLHEEALMVGIKTNHDFLCLSLELEQGETLRLVSHVDPDNELGCISWWISVEDGSTEERKLQADLSEGESPSRRYLGPLSLDALYSTLMDLISLCTSSVNL